MYFWCTDRGLTVDQWILVAQLAVFAVQALIFWRQVNLSAQIAKDATDLQKAIVRPCLGLDFSPDLKASTFRFSVINAAAGAAKIREMTLAIDGKPFVPSSAAPENFWREAVQSLGLPTSNVRTAAAIPPGGYLLVPGNESTTLIEVQFPPGSVDRDRLLAIGKRIRFELKGESTLGEAVRF